MATLLTLASGGTSACHETVPGGSSNGAPSNTLLSAIADAGPGAGDLCGAAKASEVVGHRDTPEMRKELAEHVGHNRIRWIHPGDVVTQDYVAKRLNVIISSDGRINSVRCG